MLFTKASEYALMAMIALAEREHAQDAESLAAELGISRSFLAKILQNLARAGLVNSYKGIRGGFELASAPEFISVASIARAAERRDLRVFECSGGVCPSERADCLIAPVMQRLQRQIDDYLEAMTLKALIEGAGCACGGCDGGCDAGCEGDFGGELRLSALAATAASASTAAASGAGDAGSGTAGQIPTPRQNPLFSQIPTPSENPLFSQTPAANPAPGEKRD